MDFELRFSRWFVPLATPLGMGPRRSVVRIDTASHSMVVEMGWAFKVRIPLSSLVSVGRARPAWSGWGVHGWGGSWLVNGASHGIVALTIDPPAQARAVGFPVRLRHLRVSVTEPVALISMLNHVQAA
ncbi:hypothetical protein [Williamsia sp. R60]